jgi:hypothetical protein
VVAILITVVAYCLLSLYMIGPTSVGLVTRRYSTRRLSDDNPIAFKGEAGYQAELLMPGLRFIPWLLFHVQKYPWVQIPAGQIGVVISQIGSPLPNGAKSAVYNPKFEQFTDLDAFIQFGGQKGVQRPVLPPGTTLPLHPVAFLVITRERVFGIPISEQLQRQGPLRPESFGLRAEDLEVVRIQRDSSSQQDMIGIITTFEGDPLDAGDIASRIGHYKDIEALERTTVQDTEIVEQLLSSKNHLHNSYQDYQAFLDQGGRIGLQHDPLLYGAYNLNPFLVRVEKVPMLVVEQGQVAVIKSYVGLPTADTSGTEFKFGTLVRPGHRGIWQEPLRTGKYPINPYCYRAEIVPTAILTLNWAERVSAAHKLDAKLESIVAKSSEGFVF